MPTRIEWELPAGFVAGRTQFPVPEPKFDKTLEETSYILAGAPVFVTPVKIHDAAKPGEEVALIAKVSWLMCKKECIPGQVEVSIKLPVVPKGTQPKSANEKLFEAAGDRFPLPTGKAEHIKLSGSIKPEQLKPGDKGTAILVVEIEPKHHMQSHTPKQEELIPAYVFMEPTPGLEIGDVEYPKAHERTDKLLGKLSEYSSKVEFRIPVTVEEDVDKSGRWVRGVFQYQICTDAGTCYPPKHVEFAIPVQMAGGSAPAASEATTVADAAASPRESTIVQETEAVRLEPQAATPANTAQDGFFARIEKAFLRIGFAGVLLLAMVGGFVLNFMPCVLPVVSLKILSYVRQAREDRGRIFLLGVSYCAGILAFFAVLALLFWKTGEGWGQHFQRPHVILALAAIVTAFALSLFGVFAVFTPKVINELGQKAEGEGVGSAFATGVLATMLGTACTAPFLSAAVGAASRYPAAQGAMIFLAVGAGMALPFFLLSAQPGWLRFVPRPGPWMGAFEAVMGFLLLGTVVWLLNPLRDQIGDYGLLLSLIFLLLVAMAVWVKGRIQFGDEPARKARLWVITLALIVIAWLLPFRWMSSIDRLRDEVAARRKLIDEGKRYALTGGGERSGPLKWAPDWNRGINWLGYDEALIRRFAREGYTVFVDFTASWCVNCKANLKSSIDIEGTRRLFRELNVVTFEADYTNKDPQIKASLDKFGKAGVPLYLVYKPGDPDHPEILPEILTPGIVQDALKRAGPSKVQIAQKP